MKNFIIKIWHAFVSFLYRIPRDKALHFWAGLLIATFFCIALGMKECIVPAIFAGAMKVFLGVILRDASNWTKNDLWDFLSTLIGGAVPQVFVLLNLWWF